MNLMLSVGDWFAQNWMLLVLVVLAIAMFVPSYLRQRKEMNARNELNNTIKKGTKIITTAGVYGTVQSIENTTDGKVVTIQTGDAKHPTTMTIHINAIGGIDNKKSVADTEVVEEVVEKVEEKQEEKDDENTEIVEAVYGEKKDPVKKKSSKKSSK